MFKSICLFAAGFLAVCAGAAAAGPCGVVLAARLALQPTPSGKPMVLVDVDGQSLRMAVDTGAETSALTPDGAARLGLVAGSARRQVRGLGGAATYGLVWIRHVDWGGRIIDGVSVPVLPLSGEPRLDGLIGADLLQPFQMDLDSPAGRLTLYRGPGCERADHPGWSRLAWRATGHALPVVPVTLDGRGAAGLLDTGTQYSAVSERVAGLDPADRQGDRAVTGFGAGNLALHGVVHRFDTLAIGDIDVVRPVLRVVPLSPLLPADMLVGVDILARRRLWLDYPGRRAFLSMAPD